MIKKIIGIAIVVVVILASACIEYKPKINETMTPTIMPTATTPQPTQIRAPTVLDLRDLIPQNNLPNDFELVTIYNDTTSGINSTEQILKYITGNLSIGSISSARGIYKYSGVGSTDVRVTVIKTTSLDNAKNVIENYKKSKPEFKHDVSSTVARFATVEFNGHTATEIRELTPDQKNVKYSYIWQNENYVFIVDGNHDRDASMELARLTKY
ncbi:MAG: hypothetical protein ACE5J3_00775 [Methanosarcinales archaeon]